MSFLSHSICAEWLGIIGIGTLCHFLILFNSGKFWDSWIVSAWQARGEHAHLKRLFGEAGLPVWSYFHSAMGRVPYCAYWYNLLIFTSLIISPILVFEVCCHIGFFTRQEAFMVAVLSVALPLPQMVVDYIVGLHYACMLTLFYAGWLLVLPGMPTHDSVFWQVIAFLLLFFSFNLNSLLVFHGWIYLGIFLIQYQVKGEPTVSYFLSYALQTWHLILLPGLFWTIKKHFTPTSGGYAHYNKISMPSWWDFGRKLYGIFSVVLYQIPIDAISYVTKRAVFMFGLGMAVWLLWLTGVWPVAEGEASSEIRCWILIGAGLVGFAFAGVPYLLVGQSFGSNGWITKNNILLPVPAACFYTGGICLLVKDEWVPVVASFLLVTGIIFWNRVYLRWHAVSAKNYGILSKLSEITNIREYSVVALWDRHSIGCGTSDHPEHGHGCSTASFMLSTINEHKPFCVCFSDEEGKKLKADGGRYSEKSIDDLIRLSTIDYAFAGISRGGPQAFVIILDRKRKRPETVALRYLCYRVFRRDKLKQFYDRLIAIEFTRLPDVADKSV